MPECADLVYLNVLFQSGRVGGQLSSAVAFLGTILLTMLTIGRSTRLAILVHSHSLGKSAYTVIDRPSAAFPRVEETF